MEKKLTSQEETLAMAESLVGGMAILSADMKVLNERIVVNEAAAKALAENDIKGKRRDIWLGASLIFDIILTVVIFVLGFQTNSSSDKAVEASQKATEASDKATEASQKATEASEAAAKATSAAAESLRTQKITCEASNQSRQLNRQLWDYVLNFSSQGQPKPTPEKAAQIVSFKAYIASTFADRDCNKLDQPPPDTTPPLPDAPTP